MTLQEFDDALLKWGRDLTRWPEDARAAAQDLLESDMQARALYDEIALFDTDLAAAMAVDVPEGVIAARVQTALQLRRENVGLWSLLPIRRILGFGSLAGIGGAAVAMISPAVVNTGALIAIALGGGAP